jgi:hypothetical protein
MGKLLPLNHWSTPEVALRYGPDVGDGRVEPHHLPHCKHPRRRRHIHHVPHEGVEQCHDRVVVGRHVDVGADVGAADEE